MDFRQIPVMIKGGTTMRQESIRRLISVGLLSVLILIFGLTSEYFLPLTISLPYYVSVPL